MAGFRNFKMWESVFFSTDRPTYSYGYTSKRELKHFEVT